MRLEELLREDERTATPLRDLINKNCPGLIRRMGSNGLLYRGVTNLGNYEGNFSVPGSEETFAVYRKAVRKERKPMSTNTMVHRALDEWFEKNFGFKARSQAIFCFGEGGRSDAQGYGVKSCVMFPIGKFSYVWSPSVDDLYSVVDGVLNERNEIHPDFKNSQGGMDMDKLDDFMKQFKYTNNHLDKAMLTDHEIMIDCDEVFLTQYHGVSQVKKIAAALETNYKPGRYDSTYD